MGIGAATAWRDVYGRLRQQIDDGSLPPGTPLPTIGALAAETGLTRHGARRVLERLRDEGHTRSWQGVGHRVAEPRLEYRIDQRTRFGANMARTGRRAETRLLAARKIRAGFDLAQDLDVRTRSWVHQAELLRLVDGRPMVLALHHFPLERFPGILAALEASRSVTQALAAAGIRDYVRGRTRIAARLPSAHEALVLGIPPSQPVIVATGINTDVTGAAIEVSCSISRGDCVNFSV